MEEKYIFKDFKIRRKRQLIASAIMIAGMVLLIIVGENPDLTIPGIPIVYLFNSLVVVLIIAAFFSFINWRCPACGAYLGRRINPDSCKKCGVKLQ